jgi:hypothetical protein
MGLCRFWCDETVSGGEEPRLDLDGNIQLCAIVHIDNLLCCILITSGLRIYA